MKYKASRTRSGARGVKDAVPLSCFTHAAHGSGRTDNAVPRARAFPPAMLPGALPLPRRQPSHTGPKASLCRAWGVLFPFNAWDSVTGKRWFVNAKYERTGGASPSPTNHAGSPCDTVGADIIRPPSAHFALTNHLFPDTLSFAMNGKSTPHARHREAFGPV